MTVLIIEVYEMGCRFGSFRIDADGQHNGFALAKLAGAQSFEVIDGVLHLYHCAKDPNKGDFLVKDGTDIIVFDQVGHKSQVQQDRHRDGFFSHPVRQE